MMRVNMTDWPEISRLRYQCGRAKGFLAVDTRSKLTKPLQPGQRSLSSRYAHAR
jgi:hypothetical protein